MRRIGLAGIGCVLSIATLPLIGGCVFATDLVNPDLLTGLGVDVDTVIPPQGRIVVAFNNTTDVNAEMRVATSKNSSTPETDFSVEPIPVAAGEVRSVAYSCPVAVVAPGDSIAENFLTGGIAAVVGVGDNVVEIPYTADLLLSGRDFSCGGVIEIRLIETGGGDNEAGFAIRVQVIPGR